MIPTSTASTHGGNRPRPAAARPLLAVVTVWALVGALAAPADAQRRRGRGKPKPAPSAPTPAPTPGPKPAGGGEVEPTGTPAPATGGEAAAGNKEKGKAKVFDFTGLDINGRLRTPQLLYFLDRASEELERASLEKRSFVPEMINSIDESKL